MSDIPEKFPLSWLNEKIDSDERFAAEALSIRQRISSYRPEQIRDTHTIASSALGLVNYWLVNRDLCAYERGRLVEDFAALTVTAYEGCHDTGIVNLHSFIDIKRDELLALMKREGMTVPDYLGGKAHAPQDAAQLILDDGTPFIERYEQQEEEKRKAGRYNLEEAAKLISASGEAREELILAKLTNAAGNDSLPTYMPGSRAKNEYRSKLDCFKTPDTFYDECYWNDVNKWLDDNEPRITFRFAPPDEVVPATTATQAAPAMPDKNNGITKAQALAAFGGMVRINLETALENGPKWIVDARLRKGTRGGKHKAIWCPVRLAVCLHENQSITRSNLNSAFHDNDFLNGWRDQWREIAEDLPIIPI